MMHSLSAVSADPVGVIRRVISYVLLLPLLLSSPGPQKLCFRRGGTRCRKCGLGLAWCPDSDSGTPKGTKTSITTGERRFLDFDTTLQRNAWFGRPRAWQSPRGTPRSQHGPKESSKGVQGVPKGANMGPKGSYWIQYDHKMSQNGAKMTSKGYRTNSITMFCYRQSTCFYL